MYIHVHFTPWNGDSLMIANILSRLCDVKAPLASAVAAMHCNLAQVWNTKSGPWQLTLRVFKIAELWGSACNVVVFTFASAIRKSSKSNCTRIKCHWPKLVVVLFSCPTSSAGAIFTDLLYTLQRKRMLIGWTLHWGPFPSGDHIGLVVICLLFQETHLADVRC